MVRADRSASLVALVALTVLAGCARAEPSGTASSGAPSPSPTAVVSAPAPSAVKTVIPASGVLQPADLGGAAVTAMSEGDHAHLRPLRPCEAKYPADATRSAAVAVQAQVASPAVTPHVVMEYIGLHPGTAAEAFAQIAAAVHACPGSLDEGKTRWEAAGDAGVGDESLLVRVSERFSYGDPGNVVTPVTPAVLMRVGDHVAVVADLGWESAGGDEAWVRRLAAKAAERLRSAA